MTPATAKPVKFPEVKQGILSMVFMGKRIVYIFIAENCGTFIICFDVILDAPKIGRNIN